MKCPLFIDELFIQGELKELHRADCLKEECAWWNESESECSMLSLAKWQPFLINQVSGIRDKIPHEKQFRR